MTNTTIEQTTAERALACCIFTNKESTTPTKAGEVSWPEICVLHKIRKNRSHKNGMMIGCYALKEGGKRQNADVLSRSDLQLDIDTEGTKEKSGRIIKVTKKAPALDEIRAGIDEFEYVAVSSHWHEPHRGVIKYRVTILPDRDILEGEYRAVLEAVDERLGKVLDRGAWQWSQAFFLPSCPEENEQYAFYDHNEGIPLPVDEFVKRGMEILGEPRKLRSSPVADALSKDDKEYLPSHFEGVRAKCRAVRVYADKPEGVGYMQWINVMGVANYCVDGRAQAHAISSGHPDYSEQETNEKLDSLTGGPTTCATIEAAGGHCDGCKYKGRITSPIQLGVDDRAPVPDTILDEINTQFAIMKLGGKVGIVDRQQVQQVSTKVSLQIYNRQDGSLLGQRFVHERFPEEQPKVVWATWLMHPETTVYVGIELNPKRTTPGYLNLWRGLSIVPQRGNYKRIRRFIYYVICNRDKTLFKYLWRWMAHMLQRPEEKPGVSILLIGGQGTGKGTLAAKIIGRFFEAHFLHLQTDRSITGDFNASLESSFVIFADEAFFSGDKKASNRLKGIETEQNLQINPKYQPERQINSLHRVISASNNDHAADVEYDDRRKVVFLVSDAHKGDFAYWKDLDNEINNGGLEAFAQALLNTDLDGFEVRDKPTTTELIQQKLASLDPVSRWWADKLFEGTQSAHTTAWESFLPTRDLHEDYVEHHKVHGGRGPATPQNMFIEKLKKLCPSTVPAQQTVGMRMRCRGLSFPLLTVARSEFEQRIGGSIPW